MRYLVDFEAYFLAALMRSLRRSVVALAFAPMKRRRMTMR